MADGGALKARFDTALALHRDKKLDEALDAYKAYLSLAPHDANGWSNTGSVLRSMSQYTAAAAFQTRAVELAPRDVGIRLNLVNALLNEGEYALALKHCELVLASKPDHPEAFRLSLVCIRSLGRHDEVIRLLDAWESRNGLVEKNRIQTALSALTLGDYRRGFKDFEYRYFGGETSPIENAPWPHWAGEDLAGKRIVVFREQGFGDTICMARFLPELKQRGAVDVQLVVKPATVRLLEGIAGVDRIRTGVNAGEAFDFHASVMSLPHLLGFESDPPPPVSVSIPKDSRDRATALVARYGQRYRIGIVWTGSLTYGANHRRSASPRDFAGLARIPGVQLFSLYKGEAVENLKSTGMDGLIVDACSNDRDFADAAAVIEAMDLLVTTDTGVVHVAGAVGKETWNMLSPEGFWLYGLADTTPWYPRMRLYRKGMDNDWKPVFSRVENDLRSRLQQIAQERRAHG